MATLNLDAHTFDKELIQNGRRVPVVDGKGNELGGYLIIKPAVNNYEFMRACERERKKWTEEKGNLPEDQVHRQLVEAKIRTLAAVGTVLVGWGDFDDQHGNPIPYSEETAKELLDRAPLIFDNLWTSMMKTDDLYVVGKKQEKKILRSSSSGASRTGSPGLKGKSSSVNSKRKPRQARVTKKPA